jgi:hypothetical protein
VAGGVWAGTSSKCIGNILGFPEDLIHCLKVVLRSMEKLVVILVLNLANKRSALKLRLVFASGKSAGSS